MKQTCFVLFQIKKIFSEYYDSVQGNFVKPFKTCYSIPIIIFLFIYMYNFRQYFLILVQFERNSFKDDNVRCLVHCFVLSRIKCIFLLSIDVINI